MNFFSGISPEILQEIHQAIFLGIPPEIHPGVSPEILSGFRPGSPQEILPKIISETHPDILRYSRESRYSSKKSPENPQGSLKKFLSRSSKHQGFHKEFP